VLIASSYPPHPYFSEAVALCCTIARPPALPRIPLLGTSAYKAEIRKGEP
jgi:hypothetical protein